VGATKVTAGDLPIGQIDNSLLADRARKAILEAILQDRFGERLPSEDALAQMLNVSRTTVRAALQSLERHGLIARRRAVGTTVNRHVGSSTLALHRLVGFEWLLRELGHEVEVRVEWRREAVSGELAEAFDLEAGENCCLMEKEYVADGVIAIFIRDIVPWAFLRVDEIAEPLPVSVFDFSERYSTRPIDHAVLEFLPVLRGEGLDTHLPIEEGRPFLRLNETHYTAQADRAAFSVIDVDNTFVRLELFRRR
jgi:GntR family transcriptional regulator